MTAIFNFARKYWYRESYDVMQTLHINIHIKRKPLGRSLSAVQLIKSKRQPLHTTRATRPHNAMPLTCTSHR